MVYDARSPHPRTTMTRLATILSLGLASLAQAAADPVTTATPAGEYQLAYLHLDKGGVRIDKNVAAIDAPLVLGLRDGKAVVAWFAHPAMSGQRIVWLDRSTLKLDGKQLTGELSGRTNLNWHSKVAHDFTYQIDAGVDGEKIAGRFTASYAGDDRSKAESKGELRGRLVGAKQAESENALAFGKDWPHYYGDKDCFSGPTCGAKLVDDLRLARPVWKSEAFVPTGYGSAPDSRYFDRAGFTDAGGGSSSPVVAGGRVYQFFYYPRGPVGLDVAYGKYKDEDDLKAKARELFPRREVQQKWVVNHFRTQADEFLVCMDAATGRTLWKAAMPQRGNNYQTHKHRGLFPVPLVADGVVYAAGTTGRLYAFDAATGKLKWEYPDAEPQPYVTKKGGVDCHAPSPVLVGGVVVYAAGKGVTGVEAKTGKKKWERPLWTRGSLLAWKGKGRTFVLATDRNNEKKEDFAVALDPADGKVVWKEKVDFLTGHAFPLLSGDVLVGYSLKKDDKGKPGENDGSAVIHAYRLSDRGLTKAWTTSPLAPVIDTVGLAMSDGHVYVTTAAKASCLSLSKGETVASVEGVGGARTQTAFVADGRLVVQPEGRHGKQSFFMLDADPKRFAVLGKQQEDSAKVNHPVGGGRQWQPPHSWTTAYANQPINYPLVDGRLFVRGLDAVYCYDLRRPSR